MDILVITSDYPKGRDHRGAFVQARVDLYRQAGHRVCMWSRQFQETLDFDPDAVQAHYPLPDFVIPKAASFFGRAPVIAYLHGAEAIRVPGKPVLWGLKAKLALKRFLRGCSCAVTESRWMADRIGEYLGTPAPGKLRVIPNPVDEGLFGLMEHEGVRGLCLRGDGWKYGKDLLDGILDVDVIEPTYTRAELPELLGEYAFFVAPSRLEGQGLMACEALATGMPVVSTRVGGIPEFVWDRFSMLAYPSHEGLRLAIEKVPRVLRPEDRWEIRKDVLWACGSSKIIPQDLELLRGAE